MTLFAPSNNASTTDIVGADGASTGDYTTTFGGTSAAAAALQSAAKDKMGRFLTSAEVRQYLVSTGQSITDTKIAVTKPRVDLGAAVAVLPTTAIDIVPALLIILGEEEP